MVEALLAAGIEVVVITPRQVKNLRSRYGSAGNKDDRFDAFVLADTLRTDPGRLVALTPDAPQTLALRSAVRARGDLVETRVALCNQLRAHLRIVFPGAVGLFSDLDSAISLTFLTRFPTDASLAALAAAIYDRHIATGKTHQHAVRILARAWLRVIWRCWQDGVAYNPGLHGGAQPYLTEAA